MAAVEKSQARSNGAKRFRARWADAVRHDPNVRGSTLEVALCLVFDFANHETLACFPYLDTVAAKVGTTARTVQRATKHLSELGYLETRIRGRGRSRAYFFRFPEVAQHPEKGDNVVALSPPGEARKGDTGDVHSAERATDQSRKGDKNVVSYREPESKNLTIAARAALEERTLEDVRVPEARSQEATFDTSHLTELLERFLTAYPRHGDDVAVKAELAEAIAVGADSGHILAAARAYAAEQKGNPARYIAFPENWIRRRRWEQYAAPAASASEAEILANLAAIVIAGKPWAASAVSTGRAQQLLEAGLVSRKQLRSAGVAA